MKVKRNPLSPFQPHFKRSAAQVFSDLHSVLQRLLYERGHIPAEYVDVRFEAPRRDWVAALTRPTLDFFLFDVLENTDLRQTHLETSRTTGRGISRVPPRRFDLCYMVSVLASVPEDEYLLLWRTLATLLKHAELPAVLLNESLRALDPPIVTQVRKPDEDTTLRDLWSGLETPPRPALLYVVTAPIDLDLTLESPLVLTRTVRYHRGLALTPDPETRLQVGGALRDRHGAPVAGAGVTLEGSAAESVTTDEQGRFVLTSVPAGSVTLRVASTAGPPRRVRLQVPSESYEIVVD